MRERVREAGGRDPQPSAAVPDSQSARSHQGGQATGYDAGKQVRGRKRHLLVDTCGLAPRAVVHSASVQDQAGAKLVLTGIQDLFPQVGLVWAARLAGEEIEPRGPIETEAARRLTDETKNE
ncbi:transposase [Streptomyces sp. NBC_00354]|uniref:transposase n=1 Tax=Streptomyces sp. NBC_00354 TaxID=2975723 RepID=UPI003FA786DF